jgi:hypothetical protein
MNLLGKAFRALRDFLGLGDASEAHLTPDHGWLLAVPVEARRQRADSEARRTERPGERKAQA